MFNVNMKYKKVLAICIPTYNRRNLLEENINSILVQMTPDLEEKIEIDIFENASPDNTGEYCKELVEKYDFINYFPKKENVGADRNFMSILSADLDAQFYHLMSDDDVFVPNSLSGLIDYLSNNLNCGFIYLNLLEFWDDKYNIEKDYKIVCNSSGIESGLFNKDQFISIVGAEITFLSGMVFNRDFAISDVGDFVGTNWLQSYAFLETTKDLDELGFYAVPVVAKRMGGDVIYDKQKVFGCNFYQLFKHGYVECGYNRKLMMKPVSKSFSYLVYRAKYLGMKKSQYRSLIEIAKEEKMTLVILLGLMPAFIPKACHALRRKIRNRKRG